MSFSSNSFKNAAGIYRAIGRQFDYLKAGILEGSDQLFIDSVTYMPPVYDTEFSIEYADDTDLQGRRNKQACERSG